MRFIVFVWWVFCGALLGFIAGQTLTKHAYKVVIESEDPEKAPGIEYEAKHGFYQVCANFETTAWTPGSCECQIRKVEL